MRRRYRKALFWSVGTVLLLLLTLGLAYGLLSRTTVTLDPATRTPTAETSVGRTVCRKTLTGSFPFFALRCAESER